MFILLNEVPIEVGASESDFLAVGLSEQPTVRAVVKIKKMMNRKDMISFVVSQTSRDDSNLSLAIASVLKRTAVLSWMIVLV